MSNIVKFDSIGRGLEPQSVDPTSPSQGQLQYSDGTARAEGVWEYDGSTWVHLRPGSQSIATKTANYTITAADDVILGNPSGTDITFTLPSAVGIDGKEYTIKKINASTDDVVTLDADGAETIDGVASIALDLQYHSITVVSDGANWVKISEEEPAVALRATLSTDDTGVTSKVIEFDGSDFDTHAMLNTSTGVCTSKTDGYYQINAFARIQNLDSAAGYQIQIRKNGTFLATFGLVEFLASTTIKTVAGSDMVFLAKGDTIDLFVSGDASFDIDNLTYLTIHKVKKF